MTANVCLARMLQAGLLYTRVDTLHRGVLAAEETLGHEAESRTDRFLLQAPAYVCQHCGAVFIAEGDV